MEFNEAMDVLKDNGYKVTEQRKAIIHLLLSQDKYVSAKDILEKLQDDFPGVSFDTIYRNLSILKDLDIIEETKYSGEGKYKASCVGGHHHHLVCTECGKILVLPECPLTQLSGMTDDNFTITGHKFEIFGLCGACKN